MIRIDRLCFSVGGFALRNICLEIQPGEYFVLLGPTGSGKTLLLECLCGLYRLDSGRVIIAGRDVTAAEPRHRRIGYLPQDYALFPHRTVRQNIAFGLRRCGSTRRQMHEQLQRLMQQLGVAHLADRRPLRLSGGEKQRVALARALAASPEVLLLDEPVSALDDSTRDDICRLLRRLNRQLHTTVLHVCHNFVEMMSVADRAAVIVGGRILQVGTPNDILQRPASLTVGKFVRPGNLLPLGQWLAAGGRLAASSRQAVPAAPAAACGRSSGAGHPALPATMAANSAAGSVLQEFLPPVDSDKSAWIMIRSENVLVLAAEPAEPHPDSVVLAATVLEVTDLGATVEVRTAARLGLELVASISKREYTVAKYNPGDQVFVQIAAVDAHPIPIEGQ